MLASWALKVTYFLDVPGLVSYKLVAYKNKVYGGKFGSHVLLFATSKDERQRAVLTYIEHSMS